MAAALATVGRRGKSVWFAEDEKTDAHSTRSCKDASDKSSATEKPMTSPTMPRTAPLLVGSIPSPLGEAPAVEVTAAGDEPEPVVAVATPAAQRRAGGSKPQVVQHGTGSSVPAKQDEGASPETPVRKQKALSDPDHEHGPVHVQLPAASPGPLVLDPLVPVKKRLVYGELSYISIAVAQRLHPQEPVKKRPTLFLSQEPPSVVRSFLECTLLL